MRHHQRGSVARRLVVFVGCLGVIVVTPRGVSAQATSVSVSGPAALQILGAAGGAGGVPAQAVDPNTTYTVKVQNKTVKKLTVQLSSNMPAGVTLAVSLAPPIGASSVPVTLNTTVTDAVTNITNRQSQTEAITYTLAATLAAGVVGSQSRTVMFTLIDFP